MCKCCKHCMESCYWHLIEKRFCFDESIALYEEPEKEEKNNNLMFDNMAFYDSVSVIAGRAIVTIDPLPEDKPIVQQPTKRLTWQETIEPEPKIEQLSRSVPVIFEENIEEISADDDPYGEQTKKEIKPEKILHTVSTTDIPDAVSQSTNVKRPLNSSKSTSNLLVANVQLRKKSLRERRMSKSLYLKLDLGKEIPVIRQNSMPKFYLDTPEVNQTESALFKTPSLALTSPMATSSGYNFDLYSVVQITKTETPTRNPMSPPAPIHRESSRLALIKEKIKLRKSKSNLSSSSIPHSNYI